MTSQGVGFLEQWLAERVQFHGEVNAEHQYPENLAERLISDAAQKNISLADMGLERDGLERFMAQAMSYTRDEVF